MVGPSSNVYVSATRGYEPTEGKDEHGYRRSQNTWLISVQPHKHFIPFVPRHKTEPVHFTATRNEDDDSYHVTTHTQDGIIGAVLVAEGAPCSADHVRQALEVGLRSSTTSSTLPSEQTPDGQSDRWLRKGLHVLQAHNIIKAFDVGEFFTFAKAYIKNRQEREGPSMIAYPGLDKDHAKKSQKAGFWLSHPMKASTAREVDPESRRYGGLM
ncbi:hypothetical protein LTR85_005537 [Meristemomyces frigidus]|nr:hypothetical protein LTR85_005537 [Meristemomyces frigidus]